MPAATAYKPGTRQAPPPPAKATGELPWWATARRGEMEKAAAAEQDRMKKSPIGHKLTTRVND
jgi:hypothetical protein